MNERNYGRVKRIVLLAFVVTVLLILYPVEYRSTRIATVVGLFVTFAGTLWFFWRWKSVRTTLLILGAVPFIILCLPGRPSDRDALRSEYIRFLQTFEKSQYIWGGESYLGIDCSGLVRKALILAHLSSGVRTLNGSEVRAAVFLWWHDASARALGEGYRNLTVRVSGESSINSADHSLIQPGDLAITADGRHVLAYLGENKWIQADPNMNRVIRLTAPSENPWFNVAVHQVRWRTFAGTK